MFVWLGTQISNPLFAGVLNIASISVGKYLPHVALDTGPPAVACFLTNEALLHLSLRQLADELRDIFADAPCIAGELAERVAARDAHHA